jgi:hypothetical protein
MIEIFHNSMEIFPERGNGPITTCPPILLCTAKNTIIDPTCVPSSWESNFDFSKSGTLYVASNALYWFSEENNSGLKITYTDIVLHAINREIPISLYVQLEESNNDLVYEFNIVCNEDDIDNVYQAMNEGSAATIDEVDDEEEEEEETDYEGKDDEEADVTKRRLNEPRGR